MRLRVLMAAITIAVLLFISACSSGTSPVSPSTRDTGINPGQQSGVGGFQEGHNLLGFWMFYADPDAGIIEAVPYRQTGIHLNVLKFLETGPCTNCLKITSFSIPVTNEMHVEITIEHPFPSPLFTGFDVRAIVMFAGDLEFPEFHLVGSALLKGNPELRNYDGWTTLYNPGTIGNGLFGYFKGKLAPGFASPDATINAYKAYYSSNNRRYFTAGTSLAQTLEILSPGGAFTFGYAVDASYAQPTQPITVPDSFPPQANSLEPYKIELSTDGPLALTAGSTTQLIIDIYDWQGASTIDSVSVEGPLLWAGLVNAVETPGGPGTVRYTAEIMNEYGFVPQGKYAVLVRVLDTASHPGALVDYIGWQILNVLIVNNHPPVCSAIVSNLEPDPGEMITFTDTSTDFEGPTDLDESWWDWDNDGTYDEEGFVVDHSFAFDGIYKVNHKVIDKSGASDALDTPLLIDVGLFITLQEDLNARVIGTTYRFYALQASYESGAKINVADTDGPWDFTAIAIGPSNNRVVVVDDNDPEVASFVNDFNPATTHFMKAIDMYDPLFPTIYQAQYHYFPTDTLYIYGFHDPIVIGSAVFGPPVTDEYLILPFPLSISTDYMYDIDNAGFNLDYHVKAVGQGDVTIPMDGGTTFKCLVLRTKFNVSSAEPVNGGFLNYAFIADDGRVVANVIAVNDPPIYNFNPSMNTINPTGNVLFQALWLVEPPD